jgi:uncharacterized protein (TIGR03067 family)
MVLMVLGLDVFAADQAAPGDEDLGRLQGRWTAMAGARREVRVVLEVKGRGATVTITTPQGLDFQVEGEMKLDEKTTPRSLNWCNFIGPGQQPFPEITAVYKVEGDTFTVCNGGFHGARPKEFKPGDSALADLVVFQRLGTNDSVMQVRPPAGYAPQTLTVSSQGTKTLKTLKTHENRSLGERGQANPSARSNPEALSLLPKPTDKHHQ